MWGADHPGVAPFSRPLFLAPLARAPAPPPPARSRSHPTSLPLPSQAIQKWGTWGQVAPGVRNGQSEIKLSKLEFSRPAAIAEQFEADEGFTGLVQVRRERRKKRARAREREREREKRTGVHTPHSVPPSHLFPRPLLPPPLPTGRHLRGRRPRPDRPPHPLGLPVLLHKGPGRQDQVPPGPPHLPAQGRRVAESVGHLL